MANDTDLKGVGGLIPVASFWHSLALLLFLAWRVDMCRELLCTHDLCPPDVQHR